MSNANSQTLIYHYFTSSAQPKVQHEQNITRRPERAAHLREADEAAELAEHHWQLHRTLLDDGGGDDEEEFTNGSGDSFGDIWDLLDTINTLAGCTKVESTSKRGDLSLKLRAILKNWRADTLDRAPTKLLYLLDGTYPKDELRASSLKGTDIHKVALFRTLADQVGLRVGLVAIEDLCWGVVYESEGFECEGEEASSVTRFVEMSGKHISDTLERYEEATFPDCDTFRDNVSDGPYMEEEIDSVGRDSAIPHRVVTRLAQRAALVIWPVYEDFSVLYTGKDAIKKAAADVQSISSRHASLIEDDLVQLLLSRAPQSPKLIVQAVCRVALRWRQVSLWNRAIEKCCQDSVAILSPKQVFDAIQCFGLEYIKQELDLSLDRDTHNASRWQFLHKLSTLLANLPDDDSQKQKADWVCSRISLIPHSLRGPVIGEEAALVDIAKANGGIEFLQLPKTQETLLLASDDFLHEFASDVHTAFPDSPTKSSLISSLLTTAIAKAPLTLIKPDALASTVHHTRTPAADRRLSRAKMYVRLAHELGCGHLVGAIIDRVVDMDVLPVGQRENYARLVILPLVVFIAYDYRMAVHDDDIRTRFGNLQRKGTDLFLSFLRDEWNHVDVAQCEIAMFLDAALANNDGLLFTEMVYPQLETSPLSPMLLQFFIEEIARRKDQFAVLSDRSQSPTTSLETMSRALARQFIERVDLSNRIDIIRAMDLCATAEALDLCDDVITKCLSVTVPTPQYIEDVLIPLLPELRTWADRHDRNMDASIRAIVVAWLEHVLGTRPVPDSAVATQITSLPAWSCSCHACVAARTFLIKGEDDTTTLNRIGVNTRRHVEGFLELHAQKLASWATIRTAPQSLKITRSKVLARFIYWRRKQAKGIAFLKGLAANDRDLKTILDEEYERVKSTLMPQIDGPPAPTPPASPIISRPSAENNSRNAAASSTFAAATGVRRARSYSKTQHESVAKKQRVADLPNPLTGQTNALAAPAHSSSDLTARKCQ